MQRKLELSLTNLKKKVEKKMRKVKSYIINDYKNLAKKLRTSQEQKSKNPNYEMKWFITLKNRIESLVSDSHEFIEALHETSPLRVSMGCRGSPENIRGKMENYQRGTFNSKLAKCINEIERVERVSGEEDCWKERRTLKKKRVREERVTVKRSKEKRNRKKEGKQELCERVSVLEREVERLKMENYDLVRVVQWIGEGVKGLKEKEEDDLEREMERMTVVK
jgi:hypothetical protein